MSFRAILPAPVPSPPPSGNDGAGEGPAKGPEDSPKHKRSVLQACHNCRRLKIKCNGKRPKCSKCIAKGKPCGYIGNEGQSRAAGIKDRLVSLENLVTALQASPLERVNQTLTEVRTSEDVIRIKNRGLDITVATQESSLTFTPGNNDAQRGREKQGVDARVPSAASSSSHPTAPSKVSGLFFVESLEPPATEEENQVTPQLISDSLYGQRQNSAMPVTQPLDQVRSLRSNIVLPMQSVESTVPCTHCGRQRPKCVTCLEKNRPFADNDKKRVAEPDKDGPNIQLLHDPYEIPNINIEITEEAIDGFYSLSGRLFHTFTREQIEKKLVNIRNNQGRNDNTQRIDVCCVMAVAAVGSQYVNRTEDSKAQEYMFYETAKRYVDFVIEHQPLVGIKVIALLAMFNVFNKAMVALAYVDTGLSMSRRFGLDMRICQQRDLTQTAWISYRKTWRTLVFLSTWLSSTLGYLSANDAFSVQMPSEMEICDTNDISEMVQTELTKIAILKARILRIHVSFRSMTLLSVESIVRDLQDWYDRLAPELRLERMGEFDMPLEARCSLFHVHLLYLGAIMLLYRRVASQYLQFWNIEPEQDTLPGVHRDRIAEYSERALLAATNSARILKLSLDEGGVFKRCWLVIFQSFISCAIILHVEVQHMLSRCNTMQWESNLIHAQCCLEVLEYCGSLDPVASQFHKRLATIYQMLLEEQSKPSTEAEKVAAVVDADVKSHQNSQISGPLMHVNGDIASYSQAHYLFSFPKNTPENYRQLSLDLLRMLCRPYDNPAQEQASETAITARWSRESTLYEDLYMVERMDWDFEKATPFSWDVESLGISNAVHSGAQEFLGASVRHGNIATSSQSDQHDLAQTVAGNRLLGSQSPSGWAPAPVMRQS